MILSLKYKLVVFLVILFSGKYVAHLIPHGQSHFDSEVKARADFNFSYPRAMSEIETIFIACPPFDLQSKLEIRTEFESNTSQVDLFQLQPKKLTVPCFEFYRVAEYKALDRGLVFIRKSCPNGQETYHRFLNLQLEPELTLYEYSNIAQIE